MRSRRSFVLCTITSALVLGACQSAHAPAAMAPVTVPAAVTTVPFELVHNEIIINTAIGESAPQRFMLDCGVDPSVIDLTLARTLGIEIDETEVGEATGAGDGEGLAVMLSSIPDLAIQDMTFDPIVALAADISPFSEALGFPLAGILGHSFLENRIVRIDYPARQLTIGTDIGAFGPPATAVTERYVVPLKFNSEEELIPVFDLVINGEMVTVTLDTGSSGGLELSPSAVTRLSLEAEKAAGETTEALGARGLRTLTNGSLSDVGLGPFVIAELPTHFGERSLSAVAVEGNAGNKLFQNFVLTLDYVNGEVIFQQ
jgi:predicted aspartyl protease